MSEQEIYNLDTYLPYNGFALAKEVEEENVSSGGIILTTPIQKPYKVFDIIKISLPPEEEGEKICLFRLFNYNWEERGEVKMQKPYPRAYVLKGGVIVDVTIEGEKYQLIEEKQIISIINAIDITENEES